MASSAYFELSNEKPFKQFEFSSADFKLNIESVQLIVDSQIYWQRLLSKFEIWVHVLGQNLTYSSLIHLINDSYKKQPIFLINKSIDNKVFESDIPFDSLGKLIVKIELRETQTIDESFALVIYF